MSSIHWVCGVAATLTIWFAISFAGQNQPAVTPSIANEHSTFQDPAVPLVALPTSFASRRDKKEIRLDKTGVAELANITGPGCIRHIWFLTINNLDKLTLEITVDDEKTPQVRAPLNSFFGVMQEREPYLVNCAAFTVLPNPEASKKDPLIPGTPGYNLFLPIPFRKSCRILVRGKEGAFLGTVVDWHKYPLNTPLTPFRLHAESRWQKSVALDLLLDLSPGTFRKTKQIWSSTQEESRFFSMKKQSHTPLKAITWKTTMGSLGVLITTKLYGSDALPT